MKARVRMKTSETPVRFQIGQFDCTCCVSLFEPLVSFLLISEFRINGGNVKWRANAFFVPLHFVLKNFTPIAFHTLGFKSLAKLGRFTRITLRRLYFQKQIAL